MNVLEVDVSELSLEDYQTLAGEQDIHFKTIEKELGVEFRTGAGSFRIVSDSDAKNQLALRVLQGCTAAAGL